MNPKTQHLQDTLHQELQLLQSVVELALISAGHLNGLALDSGAARQDLVRESTVVKEIATLLQHAVQNLAHNMGPEGRTLSSHRRSRRRKPRKL